MKIVHIVEPFAGGVYDFLVDLIMQLSDYEHIIIYGKRENTPKNFQNDYPNNIKFIHWKNARREIGFKDFLALKELLQTLKAIKDLDIIHLHSSKAGFLGRVACKILGLQNRVIYTTHGVSFLREDISSFKRTLFVSLEKFASKLGGKVIACSKSEAEIFQKYGIKANYIYNGIGCQKISKINHKKNNSIIIGTIGRITYAKNPYLFNQIAENFLKNKNIKFLWIGDGELSNQLKSPNISITGWLPRKEVENKLKEIDIYLSTSLWEGLPLSVLQAMCAAKPLVLSDCVGNRDLIYDNGFLFKNLNEVLKFLNYLIFNIEIRNKLGKNSLKLLKENFTLQKTINKYKKLYEDISLRARFDEK